MDVCAFGAEMEATLVGPVTSKPWTSQQSKDNVPVRSGEFETHRERQALKQSTQAIPQFSWKSNPWEQDSMWMSHHLGRNGRQPGRLTWTKIAEPQNSTVEIKSYLSSVAVAKQRCLTGATGLKIVKAGKIAILLNIQSKRQGFYAGVCPFWQIWNTTLSVQVHQNSWTLKDSHRRKI